MSIETEILALSEAWDAALLENDPDAFGRFVTDDWVYVDGAGATTRAELVDAVASGQLVHHTMVAPEPPRIVVRGNTAIVTARKLSSGAWDGVPYSADEWITEVYVRDDDGWLCALSHKTPADSEPNESS